MVPLAPALGAQAAADGPSAAVPGAGAAAQIIPLPLNPVIPAALRGCATTAASGLGTTVLRAGSGASPGADDVALVNYIGYLAESGVVFDQGMAQPLPVGSVIPGFSQGVMALQRGGIARICIPAELGYGAKGGGPIPPNAALVFQVELLDFKSRAEIEALRKARETGAGAGAAKPAAPPPTNPGKR